MGEAIGQALPFAVGVAISPLPIVAIVAILVTPRARSNGPAFLLGCVVGVALVGTILLLLADPAGASDDGAPATWVSWGKIALAAGLLALAVKAWRGRPRSGAEVAMPGWMAAVDTFTPGRSVAVGAALSGINPKNLVLIVGGAAAVAQTGVTGSDAIVAWAIFTVVGCAGVGGPLVAYFALGERAARPLDELKTWMATNSAAIMAIICLVLAAKLVGDGITGLST